MSGTSPAIRCKRCGNTFEPNMRTNDAWQCPGCQAKNPNLRRHYRSVADLCILGLIVTAIVMGVRVSRGEIGFGLVFGVAQCVLLLVTIVAVYRSSTPWADRRAKVLIWTVFGLALSFNVGVPLCIAGRLNIPFLIVYVVVFSFLFWLNGQAARCTAFEPPGSSPVVKS